MPGVLSTPQWPSSHRRRIARFVLRCCLCRRGEVVGSRLQERLRHASMPLTLGAVKESAIGDTCWTISAIATASSGSYTCSETSRKLFSFSRMSTRYASRKGRGNCASPLFEQRKGPGYAFYSGSEKHL